MNTAITYRLMEEALFNELEPCKEERRQKFSETVERRSYNLVNKDLVNDDKFELVDIVVQSQKE